MSSHNKSLLFLFVLIIFLFGGSYWWRRYRDKDIENNSRYSFARIVKWTTSLKNGSKWHYQFHYQNKDYKANWSAHKDYDVNIGDFFLVNFSAKNPDHNRIQYKYKLKPGYPNLQDSVWNYIPTQYIKSGLKTN